jgi:two-component system, cell cycle response regulator
MNEDSGDTTIIFGLKQSIAVEPKVLIVDDDALVRERLKSLVMAAGFEVRTVSSGAAALALLHKDFCPIVISDRMMPDMDGLTLCRTIRSEQLPGYVYVLLLTVRDSEQDILAGLDAGADDYLSKRVSSAQLIARLRTAQRILTLEHSLRMVVDERSRQATTDTLTGANNRRYFSRHFNRELKRVERYGGALSLLMLDIDHFKVVNDRYGHGVGDEVLQAFSKCIGASLPREGDWFARMGGEEFVIVLPQTGLAGAQVVAEKLRANVAATPIRTSCGLVNITASIGLASLDALMAEHAPATTDGMLELADRYLYASKKGGRNRVSAPALPEA